jgi:pantothenate kinase-related protein Tda10
MQKIINTIMKNQIQPPLIIFIIGTTASGKTKLSLELA